MQFAGRFEEEFVKQGVNEDRNIIETLDLAWSLLSLLPAAELSRVTELDLQKYHSWDDS